MISPFNIINYIYIYIYTHTHTHIHIYTHTHIYTLCRITVLYLLLWLFLWLIFPTSLIPSNEIHCLPEKNFLHHWNVHNIEWMDVHALDSLVQSSFLN